MATTWNMLSDVAKNLPDSLKRLRPKAEDFNQLSAEVKHIDFLQKQLEQDEIRLTERLNDLIQEYESQTSPTVDFTELSKNIGSFTDTLSVDIGVLAARSKTIFAEMEAKRKEQEEVRRQKIRIDASKALKAARSEFKTLAQNTHYESLSCLKRLAPKIPIEMLTTMTSDTAICEIFPESCDLDFEKLVYHCEKINEVMIRIHKAKSESSQSVEIDVKPITEDDWSDELDQIDVGSDLALDSGIAQALVLCRVVLLRKLKLSLDSNEPIPLNLLRSFVIIGYFGHLWKAVVDHVAIRVQQLKCIQNIHMNDRDPLHYRDMLEVTACLKRAIAKSHNLMYSRQYVSANDSVMIFRTILAIHRNAANLVYYQFRDYVSSFTSESLLDLHQLVQEAVLIFANAQGILKSAAKIEEKITSKGSEPLIVSLTSRLQLPPLDPLHYASETKWVDMKDLQTVTIQLQSLYISKAWQSASKMDEITPMTTTMKHPEYGYAIYLPRSKQIKLFGKIIEAQPPTDVLVSAKDSGCTMVDDILYVIKESLQQQLGVRHTASFSDFLVMVNAALQDVAHQLRRNALAAMSIYIQVMTNVEDEDEKKQFFKPVTLVNLLSALDKTQITQKLTSAECFPHALTSTRFLIAYLNQVIEIANGTNTSPTERTFCHDFEALKSLYYDIRAEVIDSFGERVFTKLLKPIFVANPFKWNLTIKSSNDREVLVIEFLNALKAYFASVWSDAEVNEILAAVLKEGANYMQKCVCSTVDATDDSESARTVLKSLPTEDGISCVSALEFDSNVRALLEWSTDNIDVSMRDTFSLLMEICDVLTVESTAEIPDLCGASTHRRWNLTYEVFEKVCNGIYDQLVVDESKRYQTAFSDASSSENSEKLEYFCE